MKAKITGFNKMDFEIDGKKVKGTKLHYIYCDNSNDNLVGQAADNKFVNEKLSNMLNFQELLKADLCELDFNQNGKIVDIYPVAAGRI